MVRAVLADELKGHSKSTKEPPATLSLAAMPPGFRAYAEKLNQTALSGSEEVSEGAIQAGEITRTGVPIPFCDPAVAGGVVPSSLLRSKPVRILFDYYADCRFLIHRESQWFVPVGESC
jgi:hypothetical protein